jgi:DHA1 family multidrug resistance protein-like MFS transporter
MKSNKTAIAILFASLVIIMLGFGIAIPLMPFYITHFGASGLALGLMMSLYSLMQFLFAPMWGRLSDRVGRKPVLLIGVAGFALAFLLQGFSQNLVQFTLARTLAGVLSAAALPTAMAYVADVTPPERRSQGVGLMGAAMGLGMIFGPLLGGMLTHVDPGLFPRLTPWLQVTTDPATGQTINLSVPFFVSALLAAVTIPFILLLLPESHPVERRGQAPQPRTSQWVQLREALQGPSGFLFALAFLLAFALANMEAVLALYGQQRFGMGPAQVGLLMGGMGILSVIQQGVVIGPLTRKVGEVRVIQGGLLVGIGGFLLLAAAPTEWVLVLGALVFTAGNVLLQPSVTALISRRAQTGQGAVMGLNNSFQSLGRAVGPLWAGFAFDMYSTLSFWTGALIQLIALVVSTRMLSRDPTPAAASIPATQTTGEVALPVALPAKD